MHYIVTYTLHNENIVILGNYILLIGITPKPLPSSVIVIFYNYIQDFAKKHATTDIPVIYFNACISKDMKIVFVLVSVFGTSKVVYIYAK